MSVQQLATILKVSSLIVHSFPSPCVFLNYIFFHFVLIMTLKLISTSFFQADANCDTEGKTIQDSIEFCQQSQILCPLAEQHKQLSGSECKYIPQIIVFIFTSLFVMFCRTMVARILMKFYLLFIPVTFIHFRY